MREYALLMLSGRERIHFRKNLLAWFREFLRELPWRKNSDAYRVWISEIMLQQTRVAAVIPYYERFLQHFPNIAALAAAPEDEVLRLWSGLGYYSRARNLQAAARKIVNEHGGIFPRDELNALALPGIGPYTANAILSIAYGNQHAVLDGNVARVIARLLAIRGDLRQPETWHALQESATTLLDSQNPGDWNQAVMELGATICTPRAPQCLICPVKQFCQAQKLGLTTVIPEKRVKRATVQVDLAAAVFMDPAANTLLLAPQLRNNSDDDVASLVSEMWHFPTISVTKDPVASLANFLQTLLPSHNSTSFQPNPNSNPALPIFIGKARHTVTYRKIAIHVFRIDLANLPAIAAAKSLPVASLLGHAGVPISNLTRKVARVACAAAAARLNPATPIAKTATR